MKTWKQLYNEPAKRIRPKSSFLKKLERQQKVKIIAPTPVRAAVLLAQWAKRRERE